MSEIDQTNGLAMARMSIGTVPKTSQCGRTIVARALSLVVLCATSWDVLAENHAPISVTFEKRITIQPGVAIAPVLTRLAWSEVTGQIAASAFGGGPEYIIDPNGGFAAEFDSLLQGVGEVTLQWSRWRPELVVTKGLRTHVVDTSKSPAQPPKLARKIHKELPRSLVAQGASVVELDSEEVVVLVGEATRRLDPTNAEIAVHSITTGERKLEWRVPSDGTAYHFRQPTATAFHNRITVAAWVLHVSVPGTAYQQAVSADEIWVVRPDSPGPLCTIAPLQDAPPKRSIGTEAPALSRDGRWLVFAEELHPHVHVHNAKDCSRESRLTISDGAVPRYLTFSPDGRWLLGTTPMLHGQSAEGRVRLWRTSDWKLMYDAKQREPYQAAFAKDGTRFAIGTVGGVYIYRISQR